MEPKIIEKLPPERWQEFKAMWLEALRDDPLAFTSDLKDYERYTDAEWQDELKMVSEGNCRLIFAEVDGNLAGLSGSRILPEKRLSHNVYLRSLYVKNDFRTQGLGRLLVESHIALLEKNPALKNVLCEIYSSQGGSIELHLKLGFEMVSTIKEYMRDGDTWYDFHTLQKQIL